jgi:hypothetical protein
MADTFMANSQLLSIGFPRQPTSTLLNAKNYIEQKKYSREEHQRTPNIIGKTELKTPVVHFHCNLIASSADAASLKSMFLTIWLRTNQWTKCDRRLQKL